MTEQQIRNREDSWKYRRMMAFGALFALVAPIWYLAIFGQSDNAVQSMLASSLPLGAVGIIVTYIGGPIADDWLQLRMNKGA